MLITEIDPIDAFGEFLLDKEDSDEIIDEIIELPLRKACKIFAQKGIETIMSSANRKNILRPGEKTIEKADVSQKGSEYWLNRPTFSDAGKGYAWIMLNFDNLSDENKDWLFALENRKGKNGENIGEKAIWFVRPYSIGGLLDAMNSNSYNGSSKDVSSQSEKYSYYNEEFKKRYIVLGYNSGIYPIQSVFLRMPISEQTTVEEVENYFCKLAESFKTQEKEKDNNKDNNQDKKIAKKEHKLEEK